MSLDTVTRVDAPFSKTHQLALNEDGAYIIPLALFLLPGKKTLCHGEEKIGEIDHNDFCVNVVFTTDHTVICRGDAHVHRLRMISRGPLQLEGSVQVDNESAWVLKKFIFIGSPFGERRVVELRGQSYFRAGSCELQGRVNVEFKPLAAQVDDEKSKARYHQCGVDEECLIDGAAALLLDNTVLQTMLIKNAGTFSSVDGAVVTQQLIQKGEMECVRSHLAVKAYFLQEGDRSLTFLNDVFSTMDNITVHQGALELDHATVEFSRAFLDKSQCSVVNNSCFKSTAGRLMIAEGSSLALTMSLVDVEHVVANGMLTTNNACFTGKIFEGVSDSSDVRFNLHNVFSDTAFKITEKIVLTKIMRFERVDVQTNQCELYGHFLLDHVRVGNIRVANEMTESARVVIEPMSESINQHCVMVSELVEFVSPRDKPLSFSQST